ncbi:MAG: RidA family protein [Alphaproteobacteria bacterium]|nr:RidA family protein [Alphaproteobacteria bacterium]
MSAEKRLAQLGIKLPEWKGAAYDGQNYGRMKPYHVVGKMLFISGQIPQVNGTVIYPGRLGDTVTLDQGYEAARITGINILAGIKQAVGDLDRVKGVVRMLHFVVSSPTFYDVHKVSSGVSDLFYEVYGEKVGVGCRATIGVMSLALNNCFETWSDFELR